MLQKTALALGLSFLTLTSVHAETEWKPNGAVRIIVPITGTTNDMLARVVAPKLEELIGQPVVVENKPGAGGAIGTNYVINTKKDGRTLLIGYNGPLAINPILFKDEITYDPKKDLIPVNLSVTTPQYLVVREGIGVKTFADFKEYVAKQKEGVSYGSVALGSASHLTMEMLAHQANLNMIHIPYNGAPRALADMAGGLVDAAFMVPGNVLPFMQRGDLVAIATSGKERFAMNPDIPTVAELGYNDFEALSWIGFLLPAGTPDHIVSFYEKNIQKAVESDAVKDKLVELDFTVVNKDGAGFADWIDTEIERWGNVIKDSNVEVN